MGVTVYLKLKLAEIPWTFNKCCRHKLKIHWKVGGKVCIHGSSLEQGRYLIFHELFRYDCFAAIWWRRFENKKPKKLGMNKQSWSLGFIFITDSNLFAHSTCHNMEKACFECVNLILQYYNYTLLWQMWPPVNRGRGKEELTTEREWTLSKLVGR